MRKLVKAGKTKVKMIIVPEVIGPLGLLSHYLDDYQKCGEVTE